ncbi:MAG TPA: hypothetical protein VGV36_06795, partial [Solirubrobacteraceae bacterium]|nr:hypothetical protein [Solirubrobacteraceae bacterium]
MAPLRLTVLVDAWPVLSETFVRNEVAALARAGHHVRIEAGGPGDAVLGTPPGVGVAVGAHDSRRRRLVDLVWLVARHLGGVVADLRARPRWRAAHE